MGYCSCKEIVGLSSVKESSLGGGLKQSEVHALSSWAMKPHIELAISDGIEVDSCRFIAGWFVAQDQKQVL